MSSNARTSHSGNSFFDPPIENYRFYAQKISRKDETRQTGMFLKQVKHTNHGSGLMHDKLGSSGSIYYQPKDSESDLGYRLSNSHNSHMEDFERRESQNLTDDKYGGCNSMKNSTLIDPRNDYD